MVISGIRCSSTETLFSTDFYVLLYTFNTIFHKLINKPGLRSFRQFN